MKNLIPAPLSAGAFSDSQKSESEIWLYQFECVIREKI